jgi:hypothetical protein
MNKNKIASLFLLISILLIMVFFIPGCNINGEKIQEKVQEALNKEPAAVEEIVICKSIDSNFAPVDPTNVFPSGTIAVYLAVKYKNFTNEDSLKAVWSYLEIGKEISTQEFIPEKFGSGYHSFNIKIAEGFPSGKYNIKIYFNSNLFKTLEFTVQ